MWQLEYCKILSILPGLSETWHPSDSQTEMMAHQLNLGMIFLDL